MSYRVLVLVLFVFIALSLPAQAVASPVTVPAEPHKRELVGLINGYRAEVGSQPMQISETLSRSAQDYADWLVANGQYGHYSDGSTAGRRAMAVGWPDIDVGENLHRTSSYAYSAAGSWRDSPGHYRNMTQPSRAAVGVGERNGLWVAVFGDACPPGSESGCALTGDYGDANASPAPPSTPTEPPTGSAPNNIASEPFVDSYPAKLKVQRAGVSAGKLDVLARITGRADGDRVQVEFHANGSKYRFTSRIENGTVRFKRSLPSLQRRMRTGIITLAYNGNDRVYPAEVRMRAANGRADLRRDDPTLRDGLLSMSGSLTERARGVVRFRFIWQNPDGSLGERNWKDYPGSGRFQLTDIVPAAAACRGGYLTVAFTGDLDAKGGPIRGELDAKQVIPSSC